MRILVVRIGRAGDIVMTTPALKALLNCFPEARFTLLTSPDGNRLLRTYDERITDIWVWNRSAFGASLRKREIRKMLLNTSFDKIFCFDTSPSIAKLFDGLDTEFYQQQGTAEITHTAQASLDLVGKACPDYVTNVYANLPVSDDATHQVDNELAKLGINKNDVVIGLHPTYSGFNTIAIRKRSARKHKLWPAENFGHLSQQLIKLELANGKHPKVVIDLLDEEMALGKKILEHSQGSVVLINEKPNIERYKALLKRYNLLISPDTGPMHMAAAVGTRIVALFSGKDPDDCGPFMKKDSYTILRAEDTKNFEDGISAIQVQQVFDASKEQLSKPQTT